MATWESTGINGLDKVLCGLRKGDNVVLQVDSIDDFGKFVTPYIQQSIKDQRNIVYVRFAAHRPLVDDHPQITVYNLEAMNGFESFSSEVHNIISKHGFGAYYVFDCLSDLLKAWATDLMIGNFFKVTCPYLFELDTIAYFAILRDHHSFQTVARIRETTQLLLDIYHFDDSIYVHPLKVWNRYAPTMFLPHRQNGDEFSPVISSIDASKLLSRISQKSARDSERQLDYWDKLFIQANKLGESTECSKQVQGIKSELCRLIIGSEKRISEMSQKYFSLEDLMSIKSRLVGSGFIGGKAAGMLLAQNILLQEKELNWTDYMEPHDSFYVGSDVFYSYVVENGWWKLLMQQKTKEGYFDVAPEIQRNFLKGKFPAQIRERFQEIIEYYGQSPIIVRSSSLLEDSFGNAFAGKYESIFLVNQGDPDQRYKAFENAVRRVYASTMSQEALAYRLHRGLDEHDEQMALLVQRVSGSYKKSDFFPDLGGVGISYNTFVWNKELDPKAGMLRLVFGLGTRAVDRVKDDYPQTIALDKPMLRPHAAREDMIRFSQRKVDVLNLSENELTTYEADKVLNDNPELNISLIAAEDMETQQKRKELGLKAQRSWILTFENLLTKTNFTETMQRMLKTLEKHYDYPVDVEFTVNFSGEEDFRINIVQCRPLQTKGIKAGVNIPKHIDSEKILISSEGHTMGGNISQTISRLIYIDPERYVALPNSEKYSIARIIGKLNHLINDKELMPVMLMGPGRWGTTTPSLGVPVNFGEINKTTILVEMAYEAGQLMPELSFGSHFFQDLVESDIFYLALYPQKKGVVFNYDKIEGMDNMLNELVPEAENYSDVIKVFEFNDSPLQIISNLISQKSVCFFK
ncbi:MAG: PEP/pyruvate-binding domain-containing protein [Sedimentisphaeraceae bacterium JB056]